MYFQEDIWAALKWTLQKCT